MDRSPATEKNNMHQTSTTPREPADIRREGNHLRNESSLYLQQHAHNPIDWYSWSETALTRARDEDKPIFLSIGYASCHWCHVMEHEVFEQDDVARFLNEHFICIKVDREERPDLDAVYMEAVNLMNGRGGWPLSVFLTPDLKPFFGGTYFPHSAFMQLVGKVETVFRTQREDLTRQASLVAQRIAAETTLEPSPDDFTSEQLATIALASRHNFDSLNGGFRNEQKFPTPVRWRFLLHQYRRSADEQLAEMIIRTCEAMSRGGIYDHVGGGFHRYTVDPDWTVPHFEKMLYDNAQLASLMLEAGVVFERPDFVATGRDVLDFLISDLQAETGAFQASYDADSGGEEGTYYIWSRKQIIDLVGRIDGPVLADLLGVDERGNFENSGSSVLTRRADLEQLSDRHGRLPNDVAGLFATHRQTLKQHRANRTPPGLDQKIITAWNGLAISALAQGYMVTGNQRYLEAAEKAATFLLTTHRRDDGRLVRASTDGRTVGDGILDDYALLGAGLLELYQAGGQDKFLVETIALTGIIESDFSRDAGGFYLTGIRTPAPLGRKVDTFDSVIPSGNAIVLENLIRLAAITGSQAYLDTARQTLRNWSGLIERAGLEMAGWLDAADKLIGPYYSVVLAGPANDPLTRELASTVQARLTANAVVCRVPADGPDTSLKEQAPALADKTARNNRTTAYVCEFGRCNAPTSDPIELGRQLVASRSTAQTE